MFTPIHVVGAGVICSLGSTYQQCFERLKTGTHGITPLSTIDSIYHGVLPVGEIKQSNEALASAIGARVVGPRTALIGLHAAQEAWHNAGVQDPSRWRVGLISGTTVGGMDRTEQFFPTFLSDNTTGHLRDVIHHGCGDVTDFIAEHLPVEDFVSTINTACSSSVNSILYASKLIRHNQLDIVIAGGTDALTRFTINGFKSLMILDDNLCRPFDASRQGLNLGEGAGFVVLVSDRVLQEEKLKSKAIVAGGANTSDAFHQTASSPDGRGSFAAMKNALVASGLSTTDIDYINLHGTGTLNNDLSEGTAITNLFAENLPAFSSTKSFTGHTLGACGGIEAVFSIMALEHQCVFPSLRFNDAMPEIALIPQLTFQHREVDHVMSNSFGFGGNCSSIIFSKPTVRL